MSWPSPFVSLTDSECEYLQSKLLENESNVYTILDAFLQKQRSIALEEVVFIRYNQNFMLLVKLLNEHYFNESYGTSIRFVRYPGMNSPYPTLVTEGIWVGGEQEVSTWFKDKSLEIPALVWIDLREDTSWNRSINVPSHITVYRIPFADGDEAASPNLFEAIHLVKQQITMTPVLVSCHMGQSRSVACIVGALSNEYSDLREVYNRIKIPRPQAEIHPVLWNLLEQYFQEYNKD